MSHELRSRRPLPGAVREGEFYVRRWSNTAVMGIINVTPDSFSDGGAQLEPAQGAAHGKALERAGALVIDVGGESTRPGSEPVPAELEEQRVIPVVRALARETEALLSVDTSKPEVARAALLAGAHIVNDVRGLRDPRMLSLCAQEGVPAILMHMKGEPRTMQVEPTYDDVLLEVSSFLSEGARRAYEAGVPAVVLDPGIGFGKSLEHNLTLLRGLRELVGLGPELLVGASRKGLISQIAGPSKAHERDPGSLALHLHAASCGVGLVRVHDVHGHVQALRVWERLNA